MMTLDPRFITTSGLEEYFVDSLTGLPLSGGVVTFYSDKNPNVLKPVYQLTLVAGNYTYSALPDPVILSSVGTFQDGTGNNIIPYYYPFTGTPDQQTGVQELYYITVYSSDGRLIFTRSAWPNNANGNGGGGVVGVDTKNFIPNGQFLAHNNGAAAVVNNGAGSGVPGYIQGSNVDITYIAQGGWEFVTSHNPSGTYTNSFSQYDPLPNSNDFPLYAFNFVSNNTGGDAVKDLTITWPDVNKFSTGQPAGNAPYTYFFRVHSIDGGSYRYNVYLIYSYGSGAGASATTQTLISTFTSDNTQQVVTIPIAGFPVPAGTVSGTDDYVAIAIRSAGNSTNSEFTDFALIAGNTTPAFAPVMTNAEMLSQSIAGWMPTPDPSGLDLGLPLILTAKGMSFDHSIVGQIIAKTQAAALPGELAMDGNSYVASAYNSVTGIPYQRLANYLILNSPAIASASLGGNSILAQTIPMFGTGVNFVTLFNVSTGVFNVQLNSIASGGSVTGTGAVNIVPGVANNYYTATVTTVPAAGYFWSFVDGTLHKTYNVWYSVNGSVTAPSVPSGANIKVSILSTSTLDRIANATIAAVNQYQFVLPNLAGLFLRGYDPTGLFDKNYTTRILDNISFNNSVATGNFNGSRELAAFLQHTHNTPSGTGFIVQGGNLDNAGPGPSYDSTPQPVTGGSATTGVGTETRPVNFAVNYFIKY